MTPGQHGEAVLDLQRRLGVAGHAPSGAEAGRFCEATEAAVRAFQSARGLHVSGICDESTWRALVEASWKLGDRLLVLSAPNARGDDVAELQSSLARLGFDSGRVDGIYGPATTRAVEDFQRNSGLVADGICGPDTVRLVRVLGRQSGTGPGVTALREVESLSAVRRQLADLRIVVGQFGGLSSLTRQVTRGLRLRGATVAPTDEPDAPAQAAAANRFAAAVYLGFEARAEPTADCCYYAVPTFESVGGHALASHLATELAKVSDLTPTARGMRLPVLRETRMPAVLCVVGPVQRYIDDAPAVAGAAIDALARWTREPISG